MRAIGVKNFYYVVKDAGQFGLEMYLLSEPAAVGSVLLFACVDGVESRPVGFRPNMHEVKLSEFELPLCSVRRGRRTVCEFSDEAVFMLRQFVKSLMETGLYDLALVEFIYTKRDSKLLRSMRLTPS